MGLFRWERKEVCGLDLEVSGVSNACLNFWVFFQNEPDLKRHKGLTQPQTEMLYPFNTCQRIGKNLQHYCKFSLKISQITETNCHYFVFGTFPKKCFINLSHTISMEHAKAFCWFFKVLKIHSISLCTLSNSGSYELCSVLCLIQDSHSCSQIFSFSIQSCKLCLH